MYIVSQTIFYLFTFYMGHLFNGHKVYAHYKPKVKQEFGHCIIIRCPWYYTDVLTKDGRLGTIMCGK